MATSIARALADRATHDGDKQWLEFIGGESYTYRSFHRSVLSAARGMSELGVSPGDRIATFLGNGPEVVITWFAAHVLGAIAVPLNNDMRGDILQHMLDLAQPKMIVTRQEHLAVLSPMLARADYTSQLVLADSSATEMDDAGDPVLGLDTISFSQLAANEPDGGMSWHEPSPNEPCCIMYTSGTTGPSKGATYCNSFHLHMSGACASSMGYTADDVLFTCLPLFHGNAINTTLVPALLVGAKVVVSPRFSVSRFWDQVAESGATATNLLGAMSPMLLSRTPSKSEKSHGLRTGLVIPAPPEYYDIFPSRFGFRPVEAYGLSDGGMLLWATGTTSPPGSCGRPVDGYELRIVDERDCEVGIGEVGELVFRPILPWITPLGYWEMPSETVEAWRNMWWHTGDLVRRDEEGWYYFVERAKDAIRRRGENISAFEVESSLREHPAIADCAAFALPSELMEDEVAVAVVLEPAKAFDAEQFIRFAERRLPYFAVPRYVRMLDELPTTSTQKVRKEALRAMGSEGCWDREEAGVEVSR